MNFTSTVTTDVEVSDPTPGSFLTKVDFTNMSDRITAAQDGVDGLNAGTSGPWSTSWTYTNAGATGSSLLSAGTQPIIPGFNFIRAYSRPTISNLNHSYTVLGGYERVAYKVVGKTLFITIDVSVDLENFAGGITENVGLYMSFPGGVGNSNLTFALESTNFSTGNGFELNDDLGLWGSLKGSDAGTWAIAGAGTSQIIEMKGSMTIPLS
jgi:hypothetical protein